jgi:hypothetical protein
MRYRVRKYTDWHQNDQFLHLLFRQKGQCQGDVGKYILE